MTETRQLPRDLSGKPPQSDYDVVVIGVGSSGMYALYRLRGFGLRLKGYETG